MGQRRYNSGVVIDDDSGFSIGSFANALSQMGQGNRENAKLAMDQAKHDYQVKNIEKLENSTNAINTWASKGLNYDMLTSDPMKAFSTPLPLPMANFKGYEAAMVGYGLTAEEQTFSAASQAAQKRYMMQVAAQFNAISSTLMAPAGVTEGNVYRVLKENYGADQIHSNMIRAGFTPQEIALNLQYDPRRVREDWLPWMGRKVWEPPVEGIGGGVKLATPAAVLAGAGASKAGWDMYSGSKELLKQAQKDWGTMKADKFKSKYNMTKTKAGGSPGKNKKFVSSKELKKLAGWKGAGSIKLPGLKAGKAALPYAAGGMIGAEAGAAITEALGGGELAQAAGGAVGGVSGLAGTKLTMAKVAKKLADPAVVKRILPTLKRIAPKLASKIGLSVTGLIVPEGISSALGAAGLIWSAYDLVQLANQAPEIYEALAGD